MEKNEIQYSPKSRMKALLFSSLLGQVGVHSYYLGHILAGVGHSILLALSLSFIITKNPWISIAAVAVNLNWAFAEAIVIATGHGKDAYQLRVRNWKSTRATFNKDDFVIGDWNCPSCSTKNYASFAFCKKCGTAKEIKEIN